MKKWIFCFLLIACSGAQKLEESGTPSSTEPVSEDVDESAVVLFINEVLAKSETTADWLEVYNPQTEAVDVSGFLLQDSAQVPWALPEGTIIESQGFLIIWADDAAEEGLHAPFKLSKDGEEIGLLSPQGDFIDEVTFPELAAEETYARIEDGSDEWEIRTQGSPGESNLQ